MTAQHQRGATTRFRLDSRWFRFGVLLVGDCVYGSAGSASAGCQVQTALGDSSRLPRH